MKRPITEGIKQHPSLLALPLDRRAHVLAALHLHNDAVLAWKSSFNKRSVVVLASTDELVDYMTSELHGGGGLKAVLATLAENKPKVKDKASKRALENWRKSLLVEATLKRPLTTQLALERCRAYVEESDRKDDADITKTLLAIPHCSRVIDETKRPLMRGEAYFLLAEAERTLRPHRFAERVTALYTQAIIVAPHTPVAERSFHALTSWLKLRHTGSEGEFFDDAELVDLEHLAAPAP